MTSPKREAGTLVDLAHALDSYFEALLSEDAPPLTAENPGWPPAVAGHSSPPVDPAPPASAEPAPSVNGVPPWAGDEFDAVIFTVNGLRLALPVIKLACIVDFPAGLVPAATGSIWSLGRFMLGTDSVDILDTAELVIPPSHRTDSGPVHRPTPRLLVVLSGNQCALACDDIVESVTIDSDKVHWRGGRGRRRWLAGTVMSHACALLDVPGLLEVIAAP
jgi:purine-binding chemotaxis protein CheW